MARSSEDEPLRASVLDRLTGDAETQGRFAGRQNLHQMIESVHRSLENLLNTRWRSTSWPPNCRELQRSLVNYGIPDFTGTNLTGPGDREIFRNMVEEAIKQHEPRFIKARVELVEDKESLDRTLRFRIDALLHASPEPAPIAFDSQVDPTSHRIKISTTQR